MTLVELADWIEQIEQDRAFPHEDPDLPEVRWQLAVDRERPFTPHQLMLKQEARHRWQNRISQKAQKDQKLLALVTAKPHPPVKPAEPIMASPRPAPIKARATSAAFITPKPVPPMTELAYQVLMNVPRLCNPCRKGERETLDARSRKIDWEREFRLHFEKQKKACTESSPMQVSFFGS